MNKKTLMVIAVCLIGVILVSGCTKKSNTEEKAEEFIENTMDFIEDKLNESNDEAQNDSIEIEEIEKTIELNEEVKQENLVEEPWCNATEINYMTDPVVSVWGFKVVFATASKDTEFKTLFKDEIVDIHFGVSVPPEHKVENLKVQMRLGSGNDYVYSEVYDMGDFSVKQDVMQQRGVMWGTNTTEGGILNLEGKLTYTIDGDKRVQCTPVQKLTVLDERYLGVRFAVKDITPLYQVFSTSASSSPKARFNATIYTSSSFLNSGTLITGHVFRNYAPQNNYEFIESNAKCEEDYCKVTPKIGIDNERRRFFCTTNQPVFLVFQSHQKNAVISFAERIDPRKFIKEIGCPT